MTDVWPRSVCRYLWWEHSAAGGCRELNNGGCAGWLAGRIVLSGGPWGLQYCSVGSRAALVAD
eukprot:14980025-Alexandrium_andersonii.AAC.1